MTPEQITLEMFDQTQYEKTRINNNDLIEKNATIGKLVTDENWSLMIPVEKDRVAELEEEKYCTIDNIPCLARCTQRNHSTQIGLI